MSLIACFLRRSVCFFGCGNITLCGCVTASTGIYISCEATGRPGMAIIVYRMEFCKIRWSCPGNRDQNYTQNSATGWWGQGSTVGWGRCVEGSRCDRGRVSGCHSKTRCQNFTRCAMNVNVQLKAGHTWAV